MSIAEALLLLFLLFNPPATTELYPLSLHDALPISLTDGGASRSRPHRTAPPGKHSSGDLRSLSWSADRSEEHTSELQSQFHLVCRLLLEKKKRTRGWTRQRISPSRANRHEPGSGAR